MSDENSAFLSRVEQLLEGRRVAIRGVEEAFGELERAEAARAAAQTQMTDAVEVAKAAGWTAAELQQLGISVPATKRPASASKRRRRETTPA